LETDNGFKLEQSVANFKRKGVVKFKKEGDTLKYDKWVTHKFDWPPVRKSPMYEWYEIKAQFKFNKLIDLHVMKRVDD
jgi:glucuronate isomerase